MLQNMGRLLIARPKCAMASRLLSSVSNDEAMRNAEKLLDLMANTPSLQQVMLASMPAQLRSNPDMVKAMLKDPGVRQKMAEMIAKQGLTLPTHMLDRMQVSHMEDTMSRLKRVGIDPAEIPQKLMSYPQLFKRLQDPKVMQAFLETSEYPDAASKYGDDVMDVVRKAREILSTKTSATSSQGSVKEGEVLSYSSNAIPASTASSTTTSSTTSTQSTTPGIASATSSTPLSQENNAGSSSSSGSAGLGSSEAAPSIPFFDQLMRDPSLRDKLQKPHVQKALQEISKSPWKTIKYVMDKEVMEVFTALNNMLKKGGK